MKSIIITIGTILLLSTMVMGQKAEPTSFETTMKYNLSTGRYEVYAKVDVSGLIFIGGSSVSVVLPESADNKPLFVYSVVGTWDDLSKTYDAVDGKDYHSVISSAGIGNIPCNAEQEMKLFEFQLSDKKYNGNVRLWEKNKDKDVVDFTEYTSNFYVPHTGYYIVPSVYKSEMPAEKATYESILYPTVANDQIHYFSNNHPEYWNGNVKLEIYDMMGRALRAESLEISNGIIEQTLDVKELIDGSYKFVLTHKNGNVLDTKPFIKIKE